MLPLIVFAAAFVRGLFVDDRCEPRIESVDLRFSNNVIVFFQLEFNHPVRECRKPSLSVSSAIFRVSRLEQLL